MRSCFSALFCSPIIYCLANYDAGKAELRVQMRGDKQLGCGVRTEIAESTAVFNHQDVAITWLSYVSRRPWESPLSDSHLLGPSSSIWMILLSSFPSHDVSLPRRKYLKLSGTWENFPSDRYKPVIIFSGTTENFLGLIIRSLPFIQRNIMAISSAHAYCTVGPRPVVAIAIADTVYSY